jgi:sulfite exporter TauE/SafE
MTPDFLKLSIGAVSLGFLHCVSGPDHYVPFVAMARVGSWSMRKTVLVTILCGAGHIASSAVLGMLGVALGLIAFQLGTDYSLESDGSLIARTEIFRGELAAWLLLGFGLVYFVWGIVHAVRRLRAGKLPSPKEVVQDAEKKASEINARAGSMTPWVLFVIFLFGPCEILIPLVIVPAAQADLWSALWVVLLFGVTTVVTMTVIVVLVLRGISFLSFRKAEIYGHAVAGLVVLLCGFAVKFGL